MSLVLGRLPRGALLVALLLVAGCSHAKLLRGQRMPDHVLVAAPSDFQASPETVVLHYYGNGGWGIGWHGRYLMAAPYFSQHGLARMLMSSASGATVKPDPAAIRAGFAGTPVARTDAILIGHGHVDHTADVPGFFAEGLIAGKPALIADRSTVNQLAPFASHFGCVAPIDLGLEEEALAACPLDSVRITPILHAHAPNLNPLGLGVALYEGGDEAPRTTPAETAFDFKVGVTWAFLIDLLDDAGKVAFRIHYSDAAGPPPYGLLQGRRYDGREVDLAIVCTAGFEQAPGYPASLLRRFGARHVMAGHWEDFLQPRQVELKPLRMVLDPAALERFVAIVEKEVPESRAVAPHRGPLACAPPHGCGPHGASWTLPIPGETFHFLTGPKPVSGAPAPVAP